MAIDVYSESSFGAYNPDTEKTDKRKIKVGCPSCNRDFAALCSKNTTFLRAVNHGYEYPDYKYHYSTKCGRCSHKFKFAVRE